MNKHAKISLSLLLLAYISDEVLVNCLLVHTIHLNNRVARLHAWPVKFPWRGSFVQEIDLRRLRLQLLLDCWSREVDGLRLLLDCTAKIADYFVFYFWNISLHLLDYLANLVAWIIGRAKNFTRVHLPLAASVSIFFQSLHYSFVFLRDMIATFSRLTIWRSTFCCFWEGLSLGIRLLRSLYFWISPHLRHLFYLPDILIVLILVAETFQHLVIVDVVRHALRFSLPR